MIQDRLMADGWGFSSKFSEIELEAMLLSQGSEQIESMYRAHEMTMTTGDAGFSACKSAQRSGPKGVRDRTQCPFANPLQKPEKNSTFPTSQTRICKQREPHVHWKVSEITCSCHIACYGFQIPSHSIKKC